MNDKLSFWQWAFGVALISAAVLLMFGPLFTIGVN